MPPEAGQPRRRIHAEEVADGRPAEAVEVFVRPEESGCCLEADAGLLADLADRRFDQSLARIDTARRDLRSGFRMIPMIEDEKTVCSLDVDDDPFPRHHRTIVRRGISVALLRSPSTRSEGHDHGDSSYCGRSSRIWYHEAFEPTKMCAVGLSVGSSTSVPYGIRILPS